MGTRHTVIPAVYLLFRRGNEILLLRRANTGYMDGKYSLPAGHLDGGEPAEAAAAREALEEVGVVIKLQDLRFVNLLHAVAEEGDHERMDLYFVADKWDGELRNCEPDKCDDLSWFPLDELPDNVVPRVRFALEQIAQGRTYASTNFKPAA